MSVVPPLPPRRKVPSVPPTNNLAQQNAVGEDEDAPISEKPLGGIAARIAALKLDQVGRAPLPKRRPSITRRFSQASETDHSEPEGSGRATTLHSVSVSSGKAPPPVPTRKISVVKPDLVSSQPAKRPPPVPPRRPVPKPIESTTFEGADEERVELEGHQCEIVPTRNLPPSLPMPRAIPPIPSRQQTRDPEPEIQQVAEPFTTDTSSDQGTESPSEPVPVKRRLPPMPPPGRTQLPGNGREEISDISEEKASLYSKPPPVNRSSRPPPVPRRDRPSITHQQSYPGSEPTPEPPTTVQQSYNPDLETCLKCRDFESVDQHAALFPREQVTSIANLAYDLTSPFESATEKARAIFTWMHHNIAYDAHSFLTNNVRATTPEATLRSGLAVCAGYSDLFAAIGGCAGLSILTINGHGKGYGYTATQGSVAPPFDMNHAWNAVAFDDNEWHLIDSTWGAGYLDAGGVYNKRFSPSFFTMTNEEFGLRHFPEERSYQLRSDGQTVSWESYILAPELPTEFGEFTKMGYDSNTMLPQGKVIGRNQWVTFHLEKVCWHMERRDWWSEYVLFVTAGGNERVVLDRDERGPGHGWTTKVYIPSDSSQVMIYSVATINGQDAKGTRPEDVKKAFGRKAMGFSGVAMWNVI